MALQRFLRSGVALNVFSCEITVTDNGSEQLVVEVTCKTEEPRAGLLLSRVDTKDQFWNIFSKNESPRPWLGHKHDLQIWIGLSELLFHSFGSQT